MEASDQMYNDYETGASSSFESILLAFARDQLNLMLSEVCQLKASDADFSSNEDLTRVVLSKIAAKEIKSAHISAEQAIGYLRALFCCCAAKKRQKYALPDGVTEDLDDEALPSPYLDSPF